MTVTAGQRQNLNVRFNSWVWIIMEKVAKMPATLDDNRLPRKLLLGAWCFGGKRRPGSRWPIENFANLILTCCEDAERFLLVIVLF